MGTYLVWERFISKSKYCPSVAVKQSIRCIIHLIPLFIEYSHSLTCSPNRVWKHQEKIQRLQTHDLLMSLKLFWDIYHWKHFQYIKALSITSVLLTYASNTFPTKYFTLQFPHYQTFITIRMKLTLWLKRISTLWWNDVSVPETSQ